MTVSCVVWLHQSYVRDIGSVGFEMLLQNQTVQKSGLGWVAMASGANKRSRVLTEVIVNNCDVLHVSTWLLGTGLV